LTLPGREKERLALAIKHKFAHPFLLQNPQAFIRRGFNREQKKLARLRKRRLNISENDVRQLIHGNRGILFSPSPVSWEKVTAAAAWANLHDP